MKKAFILLSVLAVIAFFGCATAGPAGFEEAEAAAYQSKQKADSIDSKEALPMEYEAADSVLKTAESKKTEGDLEESMNLFKEADRKFAEVYTKVKKKRDVEAYQAENRLRMDNLESKINELEK